MKVLMVLIAAAGMAACNPLTTDPVSLGGEIDQTAVAYTGPDASWLRVAVDGAPRHAVYALALVLQRDLRGPERRDCAGPGRVPCDVVLGDVRTPNQRLVRGDGTQTVRLMTVWSGETAQVALVCVDPETQELGCPGAVRTRLSVVDEDGRRVGDLQPGVLGP